MNEIARPLQQRWVNALKGSIAHWEENLKLLSKADISAQGCSLCVLSSELTREETVRRCKVCPVFKATELIGCKGTPYEDFQKLLFKASFNAEVDEQQLAVHAEAEIAFLKQILAEEQEKL